MILAELENFVITQCKIVDNVVTMPKLFTRSKAGKIRHWQTFVFASANIVPNTRESWLAIATKTQLKHDWISIKNISDKGITYTISGQEGGKSTISDPKIISVGKNTGKINETSAFTQAIMEAWSLYKKKLREGAVTRVNAVIDENNITFEEIMKLPGEKPWRLCAMEYHNVRSGKNWAKVVFPCYAQTKLDGIHFTAVYVPSETPYIDIYPRGRIKNTQNTHIADALLPILSRNEYKGYYLCGELYKNGVSRQEITSSANQEIDAPIIKLELHVFDCFTPNEKLTFEIRWQKACEIVALANSQYIKQIETVLVDSKETLDSFFNKKIKEGEEGVIIRNMKGLYEFGITNAHRTFMALKYKNRQDAEFKVINFREGSGKMAGQIIFQCETPEGKTFWVDPNWPETMRREWYTKCINGILNVNGKLATIEFDILSNDKIPLQPKLISLN